MVQVNMFEAKTNLSKLVAGLEDRSNDVVVLARDGKAVAQITLIQNKDKNFLGAGVGLCNLPSEEVLEELDNEYLEDFDEDLL